MTESLSFRAGRPPCRDKKAPRLPSGDTTRNQPRDKSTPFVYTVKMRGRAASTIRPAPMPFFRRFATVSIVRVGLAETKKFAEGYDAIFGKKPAEGQGGGKNRKPAAKKSSTKKKPKKK